MRSGTKLQVSVEDTGIGIPPDKKQTIFTLFGKIDSGEINYQGCGLGLSISSMIVTNLGGETIQVDSELQRGSIFTFAIPISRGADPETPHLNLESDDEQIEIPSERIASSPVAANQRAAAAEVLIVDDSPFNRLVLRKILSASGFTFAEASTGREAVDKVQAACVNGHPFPVVLMDIEMPEMDGITATREIVALASSGQIHRAPVIIGCSAYSTVEDKAAALAAGMAHCLEKPVARIQLVGLITQYCRH